MDVRFALRFTSAIAAESAATTLRSEGYEVDIEWSVDATSPMASPDEIEQARSRMQSLAEELGGSFLGNGAFVRIPRDPELPK
jgi:hypothetical protein